MPKKFTCSYCRQEKEVKDDVGTGYATNDKGEKICYTCCARIELDFLIEHKKGILYLVQQDNRTVLQNWPGSLTINVSSMRKGKHNIARTRYDVWFSIDKTNWHGVQYGETTQICHVKQLKG